ncbi:hypothetical protein SAMD00019534_006030 [Acytostelium subglobosum LB1]|uniref:hypothetical protein n=1 Tax=Acytostelium subglobosum LB1 TaxID=1410327 RepID=UPI000644F5C9|nr:hypothetical protein SAMD00019534_006030 [Acytostelium subglobosum LB1]GAM17428.1 hypothetical protein SAMD00019534_006030 [Acytostelium subglobosum LB1]|eukprot:XP_012759490.1 hypothetical protein SAMD00019534_006030 [Acytostelium subglobosum LB1]
MLRVTDGGLTQCFYLDLDAKFAEQHQLLVNGLHLSPFPSHHHPIMKYIPLELPDDVARFFITNHQTGFAMVFVSLDDLTYNSIENVLPMDGYIGKRITSTNEQNGTMSIIQCDNGPGVYRCPLSLNDELKRTLLDMHGLGLYLTPLNQQARGGKRFIFTSNLLSKALTGIVNTAFKDTPELINSFSHVNEVFRYNSFQPTDKKFSVHIDTPYFDAKSSLYSKYTMIIYLTRGRGTVDNPVLRLFPTNSSTPCDFVEMDEFTAIIFDQKLEHEGHPFALAPESDSNIKIFMRTELIYRNEMKSEQINHPDIARLFNISCYTALQGTRNPELMRYSSDLFNQVAKLRRQLHVEHADLVAADVPMLFKTIERCQSRFITNGHDYWFSLTDETNTPDHIKQCAMVCLLDYFNGRLQGTTTNRHLVKHTVIPDLHYLDGDDAIVDKLYKMLGMHGQHGPVNVSSLVDCTLDMQQKGDPKICCPYHHSFCFDSPQNMIEVPDIATAFNYSLYGLSDAMNKFSVSILNKTIHINYQDIEVDDQKVYFKETGTHPRINFASCWADSNYPEDFVITNGVPVATFKCPSITYLRVVTGRGKIALMMSIDMFNNGYMLGPVTTSMPMPTVIVDPPPHQYEEYTYDDEDVFEDMFDLNEQLDQLDNEQ